MKQLKICHITSMHPSNDDRIFERACRGLVREGKDVILIATHDKSENIDGVRILALAKRSGLRRRIISSFQAYKLALEAKADIYHFHDPDLLPWMLLLKKKENIVIYDMHENFAVRFYQWNLPKPIDRLLANIYKKIEKFIINKLSGIITVSESMYSPFKSIARNYIVVHNVTDLIRLKGVDLNQSREDRTVIYTSGKNSSERNCLQTIDAIPFIIEKFPDVIVRFAGFYHPQSYKKVLENRAIELGVVRNLDLQGSLTWLDNFNRTASAHIGCVFWSDNENSRVAIPNRLFEYMFCGLTILAHDFPEWRRIVEETRCGVLVDSSDPESIAKGALLLLKNPEMAKEMGRRGREAVLKKYNFENELRKMIDFYYKLLESD